MRDLTPVKEVMLSMQRFSWEQGLAAQALWEIGDDRMAYLLSEEAVHRQTADGRLGVTHDKTDAVDPGANALPVLWTYRTTGKERYKVSFDRMIDYFRTAPRSRAGIVYHNGNIRHTMVDGAYHLAPPLAAAGEDDFAMDQLRRFREVLLDPETKLYHQIWSDELGGFEQPGYWGCGVGWILGAFAMTAACMDPSDVSTAGYKAELGEYLREGVDAFCGYLTEDGLTHDFLDDPSSFKETAAAAMVSFAVYRGVQAAVLPDSYLACADRMTEAFSAYIDEDGFLRMGCSAPTFNRPGVSTEDQAFALMSLKAQDDIRNGRKFRFLRE
ncbi:MAG: glycoside hydrolase family 88 protein [Lachnospiraceae bacterium]|nr:glycoside hydrolase family 88 protein [Lachnospiraceae bacterium]